MRSGRGGRNPSCGSERLLRAAALAGLALGLLAGCASHGERHVAGRAGSYGSPSHAYPPPGPADDPWGPYVTQASSRFGVPDRWIREVMQQESGGQERAVSSAGAMGLMQVMPGTYDILRDRYGLGADPFEPNDNILAGTAYIRELYDRYGVPGFLAAYNSGPSRLDDYLAGAGSLPNETVNYLAAIAPRLGDPKTMTGPLAMYAMGETQVLPQTAPAPPVATAAACDPDAAYDSGRACIAAAPPAQNTCDPDAAYDPQAPCRQPVILASTELAPAHQPSPAIALPAPVGSPGWAIQVGAFASPALASEAASQARMASPAVLAPARVAVSTTTSAAGSLLYRARLAGLSGGAAADACAGLRQRGFACMVVSPDQGW